MNTGVVSRRFAKALLAYAKGEGLEDTSRSLAPSTAIFMISSLDFLNTCSRCATDVELYRCTTTLGAPLMASKVLRMMCSLAWVSTWIAKLNSICEKS